MSGLFRKQKGMQVVCVRLRLREPLGMGDGVLKKDMVVFGSRFFKQAGAVSMMGFMLRLRAEE